MEFTVIDNIVCCVLLILFSLIGIVIGDVILRLFYLKEGNITFNRIIGTVLGVVVIPMVSIALAIILVKLYGDIIVLH